MEQTRVKAVESEEEFNSLLPTLAKFMEKNRDEWEFYYSRMDLLEYINGNKHMLFYGPSLSNIQVMMFLEEQTFPSMNKQINVLWTGSVEGEPLTEDLAFAAECVAKAKGAQRIRVNACKRLARHLIKQGFHVDYFEMFRSV